MNDTHIVHRYRLFLQGLTAAIFAGTAVELWFTEHVEGTLQLIPFVLSGVGLGAVLVAFYKPQRRVLWTLRAVMGAVALGSLFGIYEHFEHNLLFEMDIRPNATLGEAIEKALYGASPILAPGILALAAILAIASTYQHPALQRHPSEHTADAA